MAPDLAERTFRPLDLTGRDAVVVAVSGGSDSTALLVLLCDYLLRHAPAVRPLAVTVDHGLRAAAAEEARSVGDLCRRLSVEHKIMRWNGARPRSGLAAAAREARYDLLSQAAAECGTDLVLTGHTLDDQAETVAMRLARAGSETDGRGLAAMAPATLFDARTWIVRPLLDTRRGRLREILVARGVGWIEDPTNRDTGHERARIRAALSHDDRETLRLAEIAGISAARRRRLGVEAAALIAGAASRSGGLWRLGLAEAAATPRETACQTFRLLAAIAGGSAHLPGADRAGRLLDGLLAAPARATLSRALIERDRAAIWLCREARGIEVAALTGGHGIWDGRWRYRCPAAAAAAGDLTLAGRGRQGCRLPAQPPGMPIDEPPQGLARVAARAEPWLFADGAALGPTGGSWAAAHGIEIAPVLAPFARFLPDHDLAPATALAALAGMPALPPSPWRQHIAG